MYINKYVMYATIRSTQTHTKCKMDTVERAVSFAMTELKVETLKDKQKEAICSFVNGRDCFVILPTGYGKTLHMLCSVTVRFQSPSWKDKVFNCDLRFAFNFFDDGPCKKYSLLGLATQFVGQATPS